jgi:hypothetical protein
VTSIARKLTLTLAGRSTSDSVCNGLSAFEVGLNAQQFCVPIPGRGQIGGPVGDRRESAKHADTLLDFRLGIASNAPDARAIVPVDAWRQPVTPPPGPPLRRVRYALPNPNLISPIPLGSGPLLPPSRCASGVAALSMTWIRLGTIVGGPGRLPAPRSDGRPPRSLLTLYVRIAMCELRTTAGY